MKFNQLLNILDGQALKLYKDESPEAPYKIQAYNAVINIIGKYYRENEIVTKEKIDKLQITQHMKDKLHKISDAGLSKNPTNDTTKHLPSKNKLLKDLSNIMGIGEVKAKKLVEAGVNNINQLDQPKWQKLLSDETKLFLKYQPKPIPHDEIKKLEPLLRRLENDEVKIEIVGSYRRKKKTSNDIDVMLIGNTSKSINDALIQLKQIFHNKAYPYSQGKDKMSILIEYNGKPYKLDIFRVPPAEYIPALLYTTGSKNFNIIMRKKAKKLGYLLNQKGLFDKNNKPIRLHSEKDYFDILDMKYLSPAEREM